jgi:hypothetical protein
VWTQRDAGMPASRTRSTSPLVARSNHEPSRCSTCTTVRSGSGFSAKCRSTPGSARASAWYWRRMMLQSITSSGEPKRATSASSASAR